MNTYVAFCILVAIFYVIVTLFSLLKNEKIDNVLRFHFLMFFILCMTTASGFILGILYGPLVGTFVSTVFGIFSGALIGTIGVKLLVPGKDAMSLALLSLGFILGVIAGGGCGLFSSFPEGFPAVLHHIWVFLVAMFSSIFFEILLRSYKNLQTRKKLFDESLH